MGENYQSEKSDEGIHGGFTLGCLGVSDVTGSSDVARKLFLPLDQRPRVMMMTSWHFVA